MRCHQRALLSSDLWHGSPDGPLRYNCRVRRLGFISILAVIVASGCEGSAQSAASTPFVVASTSPPTVVATATVVLPPATPQPTVAPIQGTTTSRLNVRGDPSSASPPLGMIEPFTSVLIRGKDPSGNWYQIDFPQGKAGVGWVTSQYVAVQSQAPIPVVLMAAASGLSGVITQQVNVRDGPGTDSGTLGILNARDVVALTGRDPGGSWLQIQYPGGPGGRAWVAAGYIQTDSLNQLPVVGGSGEVIGTETPTGVPPTAIPTPGIASADNDSGQSPAADITFSPAGIGSFIYSGDLSAPTGDTEDWIRFTPYGTSLSARLDCQGNGVNQVEMMISGAPIGDQQLPICGATRILDVTPRQAYLLRLFLSTTEGQQVYVRYTLTIHSLP